MLFRSQELVYALELLLKEHFIECADKPYFVDGNLMTARIIGLTWSGHELLDNVRNDTVWSAVKQKAKKFGGFHYLLWLIVQSRYPLHL